MTLSTEVGVRKPDPAIFRAALDRLQPGFPSTSRFVTERLEHVQAARALGMLAVHFKGPGQATGEVEQPRLLELLKRIVTAAPPCKKHDEAVGRFESQAAKSKQADAAVTALVAQVSPARLGDRQALSDFGTRWTYSSDIGRVPEWVRDHFLEMGHPQSDVRLQPSVSLAPGGNRMSRAARQPTARGSCCVRLRLGVRGAIDHRAGRG